MHTLEASGTNVAYTAVITDGQLAKTCKKVPRLYVQTRTQSNAPGSVHTSEASGTNVTYTAVIADGQLVKACKKVTCEQL